MRWESAGELLDFEASVAACKSGVGERKGKEKGPEMSFPIFQENRECHVWPLFFERHFAAMMLKKTPLWL